jgi:RNA polymerase sigma-70 factor (ECF subfamily)
MKEPDHKVRESEQEARYLLGRIAQQDRAAFQSLYFEYAPRIARYARTLLQRDEWIDELVNDVMMVVWKDAAKFQPTARVSSWLFGIAHNKALKTLEKHYRRREEPLEHVDEEDESLTLDLVDDATPERDLSASYDARRVQWALAQLSPDHRAVMELTFYEEMAYPEIAAIIDCPVNTVKTRMFHARKRMQMLLAEYAAEYAKGGVAHG